MKIGVHKSDANKTNYHNIMTSRKGSYDVSQRNK